MGVEADVADRLFERFARGRTAARRYRGAGLGLAIVQSIAEAHDGRAELSAAPGTPGTRFTIVIPPEVVPLALLPAVERQPVLDGGVDAEEVELLHLLPEVDPDLVVEPVEQDAAQDRDRHGRRPRQEQHHRQHDARPHAVERPESVERHPHALPQTTSSEGFLSGNA